MPRAVLMGNKGRKPFMGIFCSLAVSGRRARGALASGDFGLGNVFWRSKCANHDPDPLNLRPSPHAPAPPAPSVGAGDGGRVLHLVKECAPSHGGAHTNRVPANNPRAPRWRAGASTSVLLAARKAQTNSGANSASGWHCKRLTSKIAH